MTEDVVENMASGVEIKVHDSIELRAVASLVPYARNARTHSPAQIDQLAASILEFGFTSPVLVDGSGILAGHGRVMAAKKLGMLEVSVIDLQGMSEEQKRAYILADNKLAANAGWDAEMLALEMADIQLSGYDVALTGFSSAELSEFMAGPAAPEEKIPSVRLADRFMVVPFSVLNAREGWWQARKDAWIALGIRSEEGRGVNSLGFSEVCNSGGYKAMEAKHAAIPGGGDGGGCYLMKTPDGYKAKAAKSYNTQEWVNKHNITGAVGSLSGTSIFDPVLTELAYRWFCPPAGLVIDPFAGGSVRGIVAAKLARRYVGHELRGEQVLANRVQAEEICGDCEYLPEWIEGDSMGIDGSCAGMVADFIFSCPPYADLEEYSDDPRDLSHMGYPEFRAAYFEIIRKTCALLAPDRFACFVVGEVRDKRGAYYDFVGDTVQAFRDAGMDYYNEAILITMIGSLPIRVGRQFAAGRKLGKTHQNVLVFCKGDPKAAVAACGEVEIDEALFAEYAAGEDEGASAAAPAGEKYGEPL